jgi:single-stranded-DNA-specific exonuclease
MVALGLVGDMVDIRDFETKHLIKKGFENIKNPYFSKMSTIQNFVMKGKINPTTVAFYVVPYINAITRVGTSEQKKLLFEAMLEHKAYNKIPSTKRGHKGEEEYLLEQAIRVSQRVKEKQTDLQLEFSQHLEEQIEEKKLLNHNILVVKTKQGSKNMRGYVANQLMSKYQRPVLVLAERNNNYEGSARGYSKSAVQDFRKFVEELPGVNYAQGHANAFGISIQGDYLEEFINKADELMADMPNEAVYFVDFIYKNGEFDKDDIFTLCDLEEHWGQNVSEPKMAIEELKITKDNIVLMSPDKNPTLKIKLNNGVELIKFRSSKEEYERLLPPTSMGFTNINLIGKKCSINVWQDKVTPQIQIEDYEIINSNKYYF